MNLNKGFTLVELMVVLGIIVILTTVTVLVLNPTAQFAQARNAQRRSHLNSIMNAVSQRMADNRSIFETGCAAGAIPTTTAKMASSSGNYDIGPCLAPVYIAALPVDPGPTSTCTAIYRSNTDYDTCYNIVKNSANGRITLSAPSAELGETIEVLR